MELVAVDSYLLSTFIETSLLSKIYLLSTPLVGMDGIGGATSISTRILRDNGAAGLSFFLNSQRLQQELLN